MIEFEVLITNGFPIYDKSFTGRFDKGWKVACTIPASIVHPSACETDMATIFTRYKPYPKDDGEHEAISL